MSRKTWIIILVLIISGGGFWFWRSQQPGEEAPLDQIHLQEGMFTEVERGAIRETIETTGHLDPVQEVELTLPISGEVVEIPVEEGETVEEGDTVLQLDETRHRLDYLRARRAYETAVIDGSSTQIEKAELDLELAEKDLEATTQKAPLSGIISEVMVEVGDRVSTDQPLMVITGDDQYEVEVEIDEVDIDLLAPGQEVVVSVDALPGENFSGFIDDIGFQALTRNGVVTIPVRVLLTSTHEQFRPGLTTELEIIITELTDRLLIPVTSVYQANDQDYVVKMEDEEPVPLPVETGLDDGINVEVVEGLKEGDQVLINAYMMADNQGSPDFPGELIENEPPAD